MTANNASITLRCDPEFKRRLKKYAASQDLTVSQLVRRHFSAKEEITKHGKPSTKTAA